MGGASITERLTIRTISGLQKGVWHFVHDRRYYIKWLQLLALHGDPPADLIINWPLDLQLQQLLDQAPSVRARLPAWQAERTSAVCAALSYVPTPPEHCAGVLTYFGQPTVTVEEI